MSFKLRDYQQELYGRVRDAWGRVRVVLMVLATGGGKTAIFCKAMLDHNGASAAVAHRREIVVQISCSLAKLGIKHRLVGPSKMIKKARRRHLKIFGRSFVDQHALVGVASVQTLTSKSTDRDAVMQQWIKQVTLLVADECFVAGTSVDGRPIEELRAGDTVTAFDEKTGRFCKRKVVRVFKSPAPKLMVSVVVRGRPPILCTAGHPFWTKRGWVRAGDLLETDEVLANEMFHVRVRGGPRSSTQVPLREDREGVLQPYVQPGLPVSKIIRSDVKDQPKVRISKDENGQPYVSPGNAAKSLGHPKSNRTRTEGTGRQRPAGHRRRSKAGRTLFPPRVYQSIDSAYQRFLSPRSPHSLQNRLWGRGSKNCNRSGRRQSPDIGPAGPRQKERHLFKWTRLDGIQVLKREDISRRYSSTYDGFVYNIEVEGLHTYVAGGVVVHNCHHYQKHGTWAKAMDMFSHAKMLHVTACPERADGKGLGVHADGYIEEMVEGPQTQWLIDNGYLCPFRYFAPDSDLNTEGVPVTASGELNREEMRKRIVDSGLVGDAVDQYFRFAPNTPAIGFANDVKTAAEIAERFRAAGVSAESLCGEDGSGRRDSELDRFESQDLCQLWNVDLFDEGFDVPGAVTALLTRKTESLNKFLQMIGRVLRPVYAPGYDLETVEGRKAAIAASSKPYAIIIDPVRNWERHGAPNWPRVWTLDGRDKQSRGSDDTGPQKICPACSQPYEAFHKMCPWQLTPRCAEVVKPAERKTPEQVGGDLFELDVDGMAALFEKMRRADMPDDEYQVDQLRRRIPQIGRNADLKRHRAARHRRAVLKELIGWWVGGQHGRDLSEIHRRFYIRFEIDIGTAFTLNQKETDALINKISQQFSRDLL